MSNIIINIKNIIQTIINNIILGTSIATILHVIRVRSYYKVFFYYDSLGVGGDELATNVKMYMVIETSHCQLQKERKIQSKNTKQNKSE